MPVSTETVGRVAVIRFAHPPVNALSVAGGLVAALAEAVRGALERDDADVLMIAGLGKHFSAGADIADFDGDPSSLDQLRALNDAIEAASKLVVTCLHGLALGGGLELALAAHYRIAAPDAVLGLPEVRLGLLPGGGGTQRLPRLVGRERALEMMLTGRSITAAEARDMGLVDAVVDGDPVEAARALGRGGPRPVRSRPVQAGGTAVEVPLGGRGSDRNQAATFIVECVAAASELPFEDGLALEKRRFEQLLASESSAALRHVFFGRRTVGRIPGLGQPGGEPAIESVAVVGGGLMGTGIAVALLSAGLAVTLVERAPDALERAEGRIRDAVARDVKRGRIDEVAGAARLASLRVTADLASIADAALIIEAVFEDLEAKQEVFRAIDAVAGPAAVLASNTSTLDLDAIASATRRPERVVGLHFFSPANVMKLLEVVRGARTAPAVLAASLAFAKKIGKTGVMAGNCDGFIGNRMFEEYLRQAYFLLEEGALPEEVDGALERWGMAMGPLRTMDLAGQDIGFRIRQRRRIEQPGRPYSRIPDLICERGRLGQKAGAGFYLYPDGRKAVADPAVAALIRDHAAAIGVARRTIGDREIVDRCIAALVGEGARVLDEGIACRSVDVDVVWVDGYGFPADRGGPMFFADRAGLPAIVGRMREFAAGPNGWALQPARLLEELARAGRTFGGWSRG